MYKGFSLREILKSEIDHAQHCPFAHWAEKEAIQEGMLPLTTLTDEDVKVLLGIIGIKSLDEITEQQMSAYEYGVIRSMKAQEKGAERVSEETAQHRLAKPRCVEGKDDQLTPEEKHKALEELKAILTQTDDAFPQYRPPTADPDDQCLLDLGLGT